LEANRQVFEKQTKDNLKNGKEYAGPIETSYWNLMLDIQVLITEERHVGHSLFLPQDVVQHEVWIGGLQRRHNYRQ
jgi:hypothetical protein